MEQDPREKADVGYSSAGLGVVPGTLAALIFLQQGEGCMGSRPGPGDEHTPECPTGPVMRRLKWSFERQALEIKGSDDLCEIHPCLLSDSLLRQRPSSVSHLPMCV